MSCGVIITSLYLRTMNNGHAIAFLTEKQEYIVQQWIDTHASLAPVQDSILHRETIDFHSRLYGYLLQQFGVSENNDKEGSHDLSKQIDSLSAWWFNRNNPPQDICVMLLQLKHIILAVLHQIIAEAQVRWNVALQIQKAIDHMIVVLYELFISKQQGKIGRQVHEIDQLSTPVIKLWDGILGITVIGTLDSSRAQNMMEHLLREIGKTRYYIIIIDISGVPTVDSMVADHLLKTVKAVRLMGGKCIISGIRPEIAATVVNLGIDLSSVSTKATLAGALRAAFNSLQVTVKQ